MGPVVNSALDSGTPTPTPTPASTPATSTSAATTSPPASSTTSATTGTTSAAQTFDAKLAATMKRIASHATKVETLKNGAKLYFLANGREVEQAPGKTPYVVAKGTVPTPKATTPAATPTTSATPSTSTTPATGSTSSGSGSSSGSTTPGK
jgi:hypothetical protein